MKTSIVLKNICLYLLFAPIVSCQSTVEKVAETTGSKTQLEGSESETNEEVTFINESGTTVESRFPAPKGFQRVKAEEGSYASYLRQFPLKSHGEEVIYYDGRVKSNYGQYCAVFDQEIGERDLHQCADAVMNLYARYHFEKGDFDPIHFNFTNGWRCDFSKYAQGYRVSFAGNKTNWVKKAQPSKSLATFEKYLNLIYSYCGTASLSRELKKVEDINDIQIGDVFVFGGHPGHAVMVLDLVENERGDKQFLLSQSYMPAQQMQVLTNLNRLDGSPWYRISDAEGSKLVTPEWTFSPPNLMRFSFE